MNLNFYDFEWRQYDPAIGRTTTQDPHADNYWELSPYSFLANNPINTLDPTGMDTIPVINYDRPVDPEKDVVVLDEVVITSGGDSQPNSWRMLYTAFGFGRRTTEEQEALNEGMRREIESGDMPLQVTGVVDVGPAKGAKALMHLHHSFPKFLGGLKNQKLTKMTAETHKALHKELNAFLRKYGMTPSRSNPGRLIRENHTGSQIQKVMTDFYKGPGAKYKDAADDFFKYIENLIK